MERENGVELKKLALEERKAKQREIVEKKKERERVDFLE